MKCGECKYWDKPRAWGDRKDKAACRVNPPLIRDGRMSCDASAEWPTTYDDAWCGRFERRPDERR